MSPPNRLRFSLIFPTLNEAARLPAMLESIRRQRYPRELVELLAADGGSTDETASIARSFGAEVLHNPLRRAEPGLGMLFERAAGDVAVVLAADNALHNEDFLEQLARTFEDSEVMAAFPNVVSTSQDCATARYFNAFTDPFNHFLYGGATSPASYHRTYRVKRRGCDYVVYDFAAGPAPLVALAQGFAIRLPYRKPPGHEEDDVAPVEALIARGYDIAFVPGARVEHHTVANLRDALRKFGPRFRARMIDAAQPVWGRLQSRSRAQRLRAYLWPFYSVSFVLPSIAALYGLARDRRAEWLFHPFISSAFGFEFWRQAATVGLERLKESVVRS